VIGGGGKHARSVSLLVLKHPGVFGAAAL
jgi:hypothetical protein